MNMADSYDAARPEKDEEVEEDKTPSMISQLPIQEGQLMSNRESAALNMPDSRGTTTYNEQKVMPGALSEYMMRLGSFNERWPIYAAQEPGLLADAGFYFIGPGDRVKCQYCGGELYDWEQDDDPMVEHFKHYPDCTFVKLSRMFEQ